LSSLQVRAEDPIRGRELTGEPRHTGIQFNVPPASGVYQHPKKRAR
jgi:hypothetical protein